MPPEPVWIYRHEAFLAHDPGSGHPERPARLSSLARALEAARLPSLVFKEAPEAPRATWLANHEAGLVETLEAHRGGDFSFDSDTRMSPRSLEAAARAAGAGIAALEAILAGETRRAFVLARPPGHHATPTRAMGFCLLNAIAITARAARARGLSRILIVDWDAHHGNGTQDSFYAEPEVLFFSTHQWPFYPGTGALREVGAGDGRGATVNVPLPAGSTGAAGRLAVEALLRPIAEAFRPELVLVSAGFDAHADDPLAGLRWQDEDYAELCGAVVALAEATAQGRVLAFLEGGYDLEALPRSAIATARALAGERPPEAPLRPSRTEQGALADARVAHSAFWSLPRL